MIVAPPIEYHRTRPCLCLAITYTAADPYMAEMVVVIEENNHFCFKDQKIGEPVENMR